MERATDRLAAALADLLTAVQSTADEKLTPPPTGVLPRITWRPREVAKMTGLTYDHVLELIHAGEIRSVQHGRAYLVPDAELRRIGGTPG